MTALPEPVPQPLEVDHLLTVAEYAALGETEHGYTELQEGRLLRSPSPRPAHNIASFHLAKQLAGQLPDHLVVVQDIDIDLELAGPEEPGFSRRPDLIVAELAGVRRAEESGQLIRAKDVLLVIEIVSPSSRRTDTVIKHGEYADAGIPHYWIVDLSAPMSLTACHLAPGFGYQNAPEVSGRTTLPEPFPLEIDLGQLSR
ncbi:Uma2 family endonuclease [Amycolatopsis magusensis]|uniref:Uma2 family endonuclease n=1 Tax=Amycolatopsis magusensis TaxID=882444 RepID=UPI0024A7F1CD|nr:Uma2 family endonuclease [Amycolatopsis magusensis]MDI5978446.1 Uma2 family endonuclease [Amycolatopsis magusensis]